MASNGTTTWGMRIGAWTAAIIGTATIAGWLYTTLVTKPILQALGEERIARTSADALMTARISELITAQEALLDATRRGFWQAEKDRRAKAERDARR